MTDIQKEIQRGVDKYNACEDTHAKYAPSAAKRWCNCPASVTLGADEENKANQYTAEGTLAHILCEITVSKMQEYDTLLFCVGDTHCIDGFEIEITEEMIDAVWLYAETIFDDAAKEDISEDKYASCLSVEKKIHIADECDGTSDCYLAIPFGKLIVYDFKYGAGVPVNVKDNYQMKCYAVGALNDYEQYGSSYMDKIELVVIQPRSRHADGFVRRWATTRKNILTFKKEIEDCIAICQSKSAVTKSGDWCRWCPAKHKCLELFNESTDLAKKAFDVVDVGQDVLVAMTDEQIIQILDKKEVLSNFLKSVEAHAQARLMAGDTLGEYKLVRGRANRKWINWDLVEESLGGKIEEDLLYTKKIISPAQMEKVLRSANVCQSVKDAKEYIADWVETPEGEISIAPGHDKRDALLLTTGEYFDEDK